MKKLGLQDNDEDIIKAFTYNISKRNENIESFVYMLDNIDENFVLAINGQWGSGKTFFVKQVIKLISYLRAEDKSEFSDLNNAINAAGLNRIKLSNNFATIYYNAWDFDDTEPLLSLLFSLVQISSNKDGYFVNKSWLENIITAIDSIQLLKVSIGGIKEKLTPDNITKAICENINLKNYITDLLKDILKKNNCSKLVIFIDELDRCNPTFAINMLEKIKHLFIDDRFIFVFYKFRTIILYCKRVLWSRF